MKRSEIRTRRQGNTPFFPNQLNNSAVEVCLKEDVDKYINNLESAFLKLVHDEFSHDLNENSDEEIEGLVEWVLNR